MGVQPINDLNFCDEMNPEKKNIIKSHNMYNELLMLQNESGGRLQ